MKVLIVAEGKHELGTTGRTGALEVLVRRLRPSDSSDPVDATCRFFRDAPGRIHGPGRGAFCKKALRWMRYAWQQNFAAVVIVIDQDGDADRQRQFDQAQSDSSVAVGRALGVAIRTFDAWMLADPDAVRAVLGMAVACPTDPEADEDPKRTCAGWLQSSGKGFPQSALYAEIAGRMDLAAACQRCPRGLAPSPSA